MYMARNSLHPNQAETSWNSPKVWDYLGSQWPSSQAVSWGLRSSKKPAEQQEHVCFVHEQFRQPPNIVSFSHLKLNSPPCQPTDTKLVHKRLGPLFDRIGLGENHLAFLPSLSK